MNAMQGKKKASQSNADAVEAIRAEFTESTTNYFERIKDICTKLRTEIALIERAQQAANPGLSTSAAKDDDGLGSLDPGWLNSRLNGGEASVEAGLWKQMEKTVEHALAVSKGEKVDELPEYLQEGSDDEQPDPDSSEAKGKPEKPIQS
jgi:hypothetical protein